MKKPNKRNRITRPFLDYGQSARPETAYSGGVEWSTLTLNEAHKLRQFTSIHYQLVSQIACEVIFLITATPMRNTIVVIRPLAHLVSQASSFDGLSTDYFADPPSLKQALALIDDKGQAGRSQRDKYHLLNKDGTEHPFYLLDYRQTRPIANRQSVEGVTILGKILLAIQTRRQAHALITLPDGTKTTPSEHIPSWTAQHVLVDSKDPVIRRKVDKVLEIYVGSLLNGHIENLESSLGRKGILNWSYHRQVIGR